METEIDPLRIVHSQTSRNMSQWQNPRRDKNQLALT